MPDVSGSSPPPNSRLPSRVGNRRTLLVAGVALLVFAVSLWQNLAAIPESQFHPDESRWLNRAYFLREFLHPTSALWEDRYLTRGQPPMGSYVTGIGLLLQGRGLDQNGPWDFHYGNEVTIGWNLVKGNMPNPADLIAARRTNAVVGALTCLVLFLIVTALSNWVGGAVAALFLAFHPLQIYLASLGVSDAVFTLFLALATLAIILLAARPTWPRAIALGVVLGFGASTKLSPIFVAVALAALGAVILADPLLRRVPLAGRLWARWSRVTDGSNRRLGWMLIALPAIAFATFVASYPYLWPDPIGRTRLLLDFRRNEMENQARIWPTTAVDSHVEALRRTWLNLERRYSASERLFADVGRALGHDWAGKGIDVPLALAGLAIFAWLALRNGFPSRQVLALALLVAQSATILGNMRVDFNRYYLPIVFVCAIGVGMLAGQIWVWVAPRLSLHPSTIVRRPSFASRSRRLQTTARLSSRRSPTVDG
jgi:Dolichyl-phosphate-mannose-protein mannosyltransferase